MLVRLAMWSGIGTAFIATIGILWFKESVTAVKIGSLVLIILGIVGVIFLAVCIAGVMAQRRQRNR